MITPKHRLLLALCLTLGYVARAQVSAAYPLWWIERGVADTNRAPADFAAVNQGQAKWMAAQACAELQLRLPDGAGAELDSLVNDFTGAGDIRAVSVGQLKELARPFYERLVQEGFAAGYPWTATIADDNDFAAANIGQLKCLFAFSLDEISAEDADGDRSDDASEAENGTDPWNSDSDGDGVRDGLDPNPLTSADSDGDGLPDDWEMVWFRNLAQNATGDPDGDSVANMAEWQQGVNPVAGNVADANNAAGLRIFSPLE